MTSTRTVVLVDGSNVARSDAWAAVMRREAGELPHANVRLDADPRARLLDWILAWTTSSGADIVVVFDGEGPLGTGRTQWNHGFLVIGSGSSDGDAVVEAEAARLHRERVNFRVVTNDHALANVAGVHAEVVHAVEHFVAEVTAELADHSGATHGGGTRAAGHDAGLQPGAITRDGDTTHLGDTVDDDVRAKLERMRRGLDP